MPLDTLQPSEFSKFLSPLLPEGARALAVAVSGGADSMALALLAQEFTAERGLSLTALIVDHGLRAESAAEAAQAAQWVAARGIKAEILRWNPADRRGNLQQAAREARYSLMSAWCRTHGVEALLLAHHANDQAETVLLRLKRGSHIEGLSGMAPTHRREGILLLRPFLSVPKTRLIATLRARGQAWIEDPSNADPRFDRARLRKELAALPEAEEITRRIAESADRLRALRMQRERELADFLAANANFLPGCRAEISARALADAGRDLGCRALAALLAHAGSDREKPGGHPPRYASLMRLYAALSGPNPRARRTLHGCLAARAEESIKITPEKA